MLRTILLLVAIFLPDIFRIFIDIFKIFFEMKEILEEIIKKTKINDGQIYRANFY